MQSGLTAPQLIKQKILLNFQNTASSFDKEISDIIGCFGEDIDENYEIMLSSDYGFEIQNEFRESYEVETGLTTPYSRYYESKSVAVNIDGVWVGYTYYYGGGKHGEPGNMEWLDDAYYLEVKEATRTVTALQFVRGDETSEVYKSEETSTKVMK